MARKRNRLVLPLGKKYCSYPTHKGSRILDMDQFNTTGYCKACYRDYHRRWMAENQTDINDLKQIVFTNYGGRCLECGEDDLTVLKLTPPGNRGVRMLLESVRRRGYPSHYRLLCANCWTRQKALTSQ